MDPADGNRCVNQSEQQCKLWKPYHAWIDEAILNLPTHPKDRIAEFCLGVSQRFMG